MNVGEVRPPCYYIAILFVCVTASDSYTDLDPDYILREYLNLNLKCPGRAAYPIPIPYYTVPAFYRGTSITCLNKTHQRCIDERC